LAEYDVVGDVHGCLKTLHNLMDQLGYERSGRHSAGRRLAFVGDIVTRGAHSAETFDYIARLVGTGRASMARGNKDAAWAGGRPEEKWVSSFPLQLMLDDGRLLVVHAAIRSDLIGRVDEEAEHWCLRGGAEPGESGTEIRPDWQAMYDGDPFVVAGHSVVREPRFREAGGGSVIIDTGAAYGGKAWDRFTGEAFRGYLSALRWPERRIVSVPTHPDDLVAT
jgi:hypothetical protein